MDARLSYILQLQAKLRILSLLLMWDNGSLYLSLRIKYETLVSDFGGLILKFKTLVSAKDIVSVQSYVLLWTPNSMLASCMTNLYVFSVSIFEPS